ncbi:O-antigen ligase [Halorubrum sp. T3]|uniref:O-antigen ligase family protein n=1 Tax=Halorubrum sp. T3 TaxID=1194088 RepID=UPI00035CBB72|nr:hypothetical protein [Halorubrum sp. T3]
MVSSVLTSSLPHLRKIETVGIVIGALLSPFWFFTIGGVNLNPVDFVLIFVLAWFVLRTGLLPYSLSRQSGIAIVIFLGIVGLSILWSPNKPSGLLSFAQYLFIFVGVVPIVSYSLRDRSMRWRVFLVIWGVTTVLTLLGIYTYVSGDAQRFRDIMLWYNNQNQFFWLVATAFLCSIALALEESIPLGIRFVSVVLAAAEAVLIVRGMTLSAIMMVAGGVWLFGAWLAQRHAKWVRVAFATATVSAGILALVAIVRYWDVIYIQGSLYARIPQYTTAIRVGVQHFPLGMGIDAYPPSVHNFVLNYFVEVGIIGAAAFLALVLIWCRDVALRSLRYPFQVQPFEFAFVAIFGTYLLVICFQPIPVQRFWWLLFGASWAVAQDRLPNIEPQ